MEEEQMDNEEYLANLNIIKTEQNQGVQYNIKRA